MGMTKEGAQKLKATMIEKHGSEEAWKAEMRRIGAIGGTKGRTGGFYQNRELASILGQKGGRISRRGKAKHDTN